ncbi:MAG TPA: DNA-directed RNA polymerase subunit omega [Actinomycetota bacterium]|nr:DNA-directed RNA polymerase subunit omega [Actinomycetota bacterium]
MIEPKIEHLLDRVDNQYTMVVLSARRARQITDYYATLGAGAVEKPLPPLLDTSVHGMKPLSVSFQEIVTDRVGWERPPEAEETIK